MGSTALGRALRQHGVLAVFVFLLVGVGTLWSAFVPEDQYQATAVVSIAPATAEVSTQSVQYIIPSIQAQVSGSSDAAEVRESLPASLRTSSWSTATSVEPGSGVMSITVTSLDPRVPAPAANAYAELLTGRRQATIPVQVVVIDPATGSFSISTRNRTLVAGFVLAAILGALAALARLAWSESNPRRIERYTASGSRREPGLPVSSAARRP